MRLDEYKKRHAKQLTTTEETLLNLRVNVEKAKYDLREKEVSEQKSMLYRTTYVQSYKESYQDTMHFENIVIPVTYQSRYDHTVLSSTPSEFIKARHKGILTSILLIVIALIQLYIVWENPVVEIRNVLYKIEFGCSAIVFVKAVYWLIKGGLGQFLNT